jgi:sulfate transport system ATP-binding protein
LGDVNLFHGRAHEGLLHLDGVSIDSPEHADTQDAKAFAYVRPHDLDVQRYQPGLTGIVARLERAIVVGPIARLELLPIDTAAPSGHDPLIEAQIGAERFKELGFKEGDKLVVSPKKARVFLTPETAATA